MIKSILGKGVFLLTLDTELAWGTRGDKNYHKHYSETRSVIKDLLKLCEQYEIPATWAVVGHLFLENCDGQHEDVVNPGYGWLKDDWFSIDPGSSLAQAPEWYGLDVIKLIKENKVNHEIGCHTFSHVLVEPGCGRECFASELDKCSQLAQAQGTELKSFVFPQNKVGFLGELKKNNYLAYRGIDENWYKGLPGMVKKIGHLVDDYLALPAPTVLPDKKEGIWNIPGSYFYTHADGWAKFLPVGWRVKKVKAGLKKAADNNKIFHLWFHPFNIVSHKQKLLAGIEKIFIIVNKYRQSGQIDVMTMAGLAKNLNEANAGK